MTWISLGKFDSNRDETLYLLSMGWMTDGFGNADEWGLYVTPISVDLQDLQDATLQETAQEVDSDMPLTDLVGHFIILCNSQGFISVEKYDTLRERDRELGKYEDAYSDWDSDEDEDLGPTMGDYYS